MTEKTDSFDLAAEIEKFELMPLSDKEFRLLSEFVYGHFGIVITEHKRSLLVGRLQKIVKSRGFSSFIDYYHFLEKTNDKEVLSELANRISTNHTFFFREAEHFDLFREIVLPDIRDHALRKNKKDLRIWCAASSSGEEPYTIVISMMEYFGADYRFWDAGLLATDISEKMLTAAGEGVYSDERLNETPTAIRNKYFDKLGASQWAVKDFLKKEVLYRRFNLMNNVFPFKQPMDVIFCRNVMIYFDADTRDTLIEKLRQSLRPGGYLFIGHSETMGRNREGFRYIKPAMYQRI